MADFVKCIEYLKKTDTSEQDINVVECLLLLCCVLYYSTLYRKYCTKKALIYLVHLLINNDCQWSVFLLVQPNALKVVRISNHNRYN